MLSAAGQAFEELFTPAFRSALLKCVGFTIGLLIVLIIGIEWAFNHFVQWPSWVEKTIEWLGGLALVVGSIFLIPAVSSLIAGLYVDDIAAEVERTAYPQDPPGKELATRPAIGLALKFFIVVLAVNIVAMFLLLVPGINLIAFYLGNGYLLGREYFELAAMIFFWLFDLRVSTHLLLGGLVSFFTATMIYVIAILDTAFRGEIGVSPEALQVVYRQIHRTSEGLGVRA